jgi:glycosyltransferase involved in cell wall biosynthesis
MTTNGPPQISVIIPAYNAEGLIGSTLDSVLDQTYQDFEILVVDDGSTDGTGEVVQSYGEPVRYRRKENGGTASARNVGLQEARGEYVAFLDADDRWYPTKLERQMSLHEAHPDLAWSYTDSYLVDAESGTILVRKSQVRPRTGGDVLRPLLRGNFIAPSTLVVRRSVFDTVGTFDESAFYHSAEDWELWMKIAARHPIYFLNEPLVETRQHTGRKTKTMDLDRALVERLTIIQEAVDRNPDRLADAQEEAQSRVLLNFGRKWMEREERGRARTLFARALRHDPRCWAAWAYGVATVLPRPLLQILGRGRDLILRLMRETGSPSTGPLPREGGG